MKFLPDQWTKSGFRHRVVERRGMVVLVSRLALNHRQPHFEVAKIRVNPERSFHGRRIEQGEAYPSSMEWGVRGWTYCTLEEAQAKFAALVKAAP